MICLAIPLFNAEASSGAPSKGLASDSSMQSAFNSLIQSYYDSWKLIDGYSPLEGFAVTSGLPADGDNTFGYARSIKGEAPKDTIVSISIYKYDEAASEFYAVNTISLDPIGTFEFFDTTISLDSGDNYIIVTASRYPSYALASSVIKCKDLEIKIILESGIAFPGQWINSQTEAESINHE